MADKPKPPSIKAPKVVPGKETARRIGVDTAFIDGLAAGLTEDEPESKKGTAESSGPLFKADDVKKADKADDDPLAALLPDLDDEAKPPSPPPPPPPSRKDDLLAALAKESEDEDLKVTVPAEKPLPKGEATPAFDADAEKATPEQEPKEEPKKAAPPAPKEEPKKAPAPAPAVATEEPESNTHPGMWFVAAACLLGTALPILMAGSPPERPGAQGPVPVPVSAKARAKAPGKRDLGKARAGKYVFAKKAAAGNGAGASAADAKGPEAEEPEEPEEIVEIEDDPPTKARRKGPGKDKAEPEVEKTASQLLTEAKAAYSKGRAGEAYKLASAANRKHRSTEALTLKAKAACKLGNQGAAKSAFEALPMGAPRREVRPVCRDRGIRLGL